MFSSHSFSTSSSLDVPAGVTQDEGHTGFSIHLPSAVHALIFLAKKIQPSLYLVDREVELCVLTTNRSSPVGHFLIYFNLFFWSKKSPFPGSNSRPNVSEGYEVTSELPGRCASLSHTHYWYEVGMLKVSATVLYHLCANSIHIMAITLTCIYIYPQHRGIKLSILLVVA